MKVGDLFLFLLLSQLHSTAEPVPRCQSRERCCTIALLKHAGHCNPNTQLGIETASAIIWKTVDMIHGLPGNSQGFLNMSTGKRTVNPYASGQKGEQKQNKSKQTVVSTVSGCTFPRVAVVPVP